MEFKAFGSGIEVNGRTVLSIVNSADAVRFLRAAILARHGLGSMDGAELALDPDGWYSQQAWLDAFKEIADRVGARALFSIGEAIPKNAEFPPWVTDIDSAIRSIDIAYHMNHRKEGKVMFDPDRNVMLEGIGHYGYERVASGKVIRATCANPYPCPFDQGIVTTMAKRFEPHATVDHEMGACRARGDEECTYTIRW